jgi:hypothetical protein
MGQRVYGYALVWVADKWGELLTCAVGLGRLNHVDP